MSYRQLSRFRFALACVACVAFAQSAAGPASVAAPWRQVTLQGAFSGGRTFPILENGYLVAHRRQIARDTNSAVFLTSLTGQAVSFPVSLPGATTVRVEHASVTPQGHVLLAGAYVTSDNNADELAQAPLDAVNFIAELDMTGKLLSVRNLGNFTPSRVCASQDGSWWALGEVWPDELNGQTGYATLRQYGPDGTLKGSYLPRSALSQKSLNLHEHLAGSQYALLRCGTSSIAAYIGSGVPGGNFVFAEVNAAGGNSQIVSVGKTAGSKFPGIITGMALLSPHVVYATFSKGGLYQLILGQSNTGTWTPVPSSAAASASAQKAPISFVLGRDQNSLVHLIGTVSSAPTAATTVYWTAVN